MSYIIVGLGNPGEEYENTRHNTGRMAAEIFVNKNELPEFTESAKYRALISEGKIGKEKVLVALPQTFMNKSGEAVRQLKDLKFKVKGKIKIAENLIVVNDDLDLPLGRFKISFNKSAGGHRGVESVAKAIKTEAFTRVRVGISAPGSAKTGGVKKPKGEEAVVKHILGKFKPAETEILKKTLKKVSEAVRLIVTDGKDRAMAVYNKAS